MIIYKITNKINNKIYIGLTRKTAEIRWEEHKENIGNPNSNVYNTMLSRALRKYSIENFKVETIDKATNIIELSEKEIFWIRFYNSANREKGYNILRGGLKFDTDSFHTYWEYLTEEERQNYKMDMAKLKQGSPSKKSKHTSIFVGVCKQSHGNRKYIAHIVFEKESYRKNFFTEREAAIFYDKLALYFYGEDAKTNFRNTFTKEELEEAFFSLRERVVYCHIHPHKYKGVIFCKNHNKWVGKFYIKNKMIFSVYRDTEEEAYQARQARAKELNLIPLDSPV